jgi:hypothetical protein
MRCRVCKHPNRVRIERALVEGETPAAVAARLGDGIASAVSVAAHLKNHLPARLRAAQRLKEANSADGLLSRLHRRDEDFAAVQRKAMADGDLAAAVSAVRGRVGIIELTARLTGVMLQPSAVAVNLNLEPELLERIAQTYLTRHSTPAALAAPAIESEGTE